MKNKQILYRTLLWLFCILIFAYPLDCVAENEPKISVSIEGYLYVVSQSGITIVGYEGNEVDLRIPSKIDGLPVIEIGSSAFARNKTIWSVIMPNTLLGIGSSAFDETEVRTIILPDGLLWIGEGAFARSKLTSILIPESVIDMERAVFYYCFHLRSVRIDAQIEVLKDTMFFECINLYDVKLPQTLRIIEEQAFYGCNLLEKVPFPSSLEEIGDRAFLDCDQFTPIVSETVKIGEQVFGYD